MRRSIVAALLMCAGSGVVWFGSVSSADAPAPTTTTTTVPSTTIPPSTTTTVPASTTTTTSIPAGDWLCPEWVGLAIQVGWPSDQLVMLDRIVFRESTCRADAHNESDPGSVGSIGLAQINSGGWCDPNQYWPSGFMQVQNIGVTTCDDLFDPAVNLRAALVIWQRQNGFGAWGM